MNTEGKEQRRQKGKPYDGLRSVSINGIKKRVTIAALPDMYEAQSLSCLKTGQTSHTRRLGPGAYGQAAFNI